MEERKSADEELARAFISLFPQYPEGPDTVVKDKFGDKYIKLVVIINSLLKENRLHLFRSGETLVYRLVQSEKAAKLKGLGPEQMMIYQVIERAGNKGIWVRDIKNQTKILQQTLTKSLKILETRQLIKSVKSVTSKSKKLYMLFDLAPAKEITGGPWYTENEFDHEFVEELCKFVYQFIRTQGMASLQQIADRVRVSGISKVELTPDEVELIVNSLVYDGRIEEVPANAMLLQTSENTTMFKASPVLSTFNNYTDVPCGMCPVVHQCTEDGVISPTTCIYMTKWLELNELDF
eukprot:CAMPEP_0117745418 /NCGR_PEP_ID=MMETSP0947-20121206/7344_1 /TAXON_ID=44440 /ORGANISM="Chattonella subsalsa, Strain CCMP2191" /LENGTH=292 /DNA_ID=CAMNT_0005562557 /DNA_START=23 /DNA_END=901 /DNA_ORIENTATION=+